MRVAWVPSLLIMSVCSPLLRLLCWSWLMKRLAGLLSQPMLLGLVSAPVKYMVAVFSVLSLGRGPRGPHPVGLMKTVESGFIDELIDRDH
jgi:hypothetical protein